VSPLDPGGAEASGPEPIYPLTVQQ
jgi:hypothetical protein